MSRKVFVLHSSLAPTAVAEAIRRSIDEERWTPFSLSGYRGDSPLLGEVGKNAFRVQKRKYYRNDFAGQFFGRFEPEAGGTRIEGYFDSPRGARYFIRIWLALAVLIGSPIFVRTVIDVVTGSHHMSGDKWVGLVVPFVLVLGGTVLPKFGRRLGRSNERFILEQVQTMLGARLDLSAPQ
jgi:hypothetical protein